MISFEWWQFLISIVTIVWIVTATLQTVQMIYKVGKYRDMNCVHAQTAATTALYEM